MCLGVLAMGTKNLWAELSRALWLFVYFPLYSHATQEQTILDTSNKVNARLVPSTTWYRASKNEARAAYRRI